MKMKKIIILDNYDSFTYNLLHSIEKILNASIDVVRNDQVDIKYFEKYDKIVLSPGPGIPDEAGILKAVIKEYAPKKSILGVCLGNQAIGEVFGGTLVNLDKVYHGVSTEITVKDKNEKIFKGVPEKFEGGRYHSWIVDKKNLPDCFIITAEDENGQIMGLKHKQYDLRGVQFHPESVLTPEGDKIIKNWLEI
jgi:anthranilate synthase component II